MIVAIEITTGTDFFSGSLQGNGEKGVDGLHREVGTEELKGEGYEGRKEWVDCKKVRLEGRKK